MSLKKHYIFVCLNQRPDGHPKGCCSSAGAVDIRMRLQELIEEREISDTVRVVGSTCLGLCEDGPVIAIYPDNVWYAGVDLEDTEKVVDEHLIGGNPVEEFRLEKKE